jgi:hypothetical protein
MVADIAALPPDPPPPPVAPWPSPLAPAARAAALGVDPLAYLPELPPTVPGRTSGRHLVAASLARVSGWERTILGTRQEAASFARLSG